MKKALILLLGNVLCLGIAQGQSTQTVKGTVTEKDGETPVPFAFVTVSGTNPAISVMTDTSGRFVAAGVPVGRHDVEVRCVGYVPAMLKEILVGSGKEVVLDVRLREALQALSGATVRPRVNKAEPLNAMALAGGRMLSVEEASRYVGSLDDPARLASSFAGVVANIGNNGIVVRGNAPKFLQWRIEDVEIPNPNHFADVTSFGGGGFTSLSSQVLGNSDFFTGAFPAEYDNALSGVFDMNLRNGNNARYEHTAQVSFLGLDAASEGPFGKNYNGSYLFNYRYSTLSLLSPLLPEDAEGTNYQDLSFKLVFPTRRLGAFSVWGTGLIDRSGTEAETDRTKWSYDQDREDQDVKQYMGAAGIGHKVSAGRGAFLKTTLAVTVSGLDMHTERMDMDYESLAPVPQNVIKNTNWTFVFSSAFSKKYGRHHTNKSGLRVRGMKYDLLMRDRQEGASSLLTLAEETGFSTLLTAYSSSMFQFGGRWSMSAGINANWFTLNRHYTVEPRMNVKYQLAPGSSLYLAYGLHSRLEMLHYYFTQKDGEKVNKDLDFTKAHHLSFGYDLALGGGRHLKIEPYMQYLYDVPVLPGTTYSFLNLQGDEDWFLSDRLSNDGKGLNYGVDLTFEQYMQRGLYYMVTASVFDSRYRTADGAWYNTRYNRRFVCNLLAGKEWTIRQNLLGLSGRLTFQGGDRYSPIDEAASVSAQTAVYDESHPYTEQFAPVFVAHLTLSYKINRRKVSHEFAAKVINLTGYKDYYGHRYNYMTHQTEPEREANVVPNLCYKIEF